MMAKKVSFGDKGLDQLVAGINVVGNAVKVCTYVCMDKKYPACLMVASYAP